MFSAAMQAHYSTASRLAYITEQVQVRETEVDTKRFAKVFFTQKIIASHVYNDTKHILGLSQMYGEQTWCLK